MLCKQAAQLLFNTGQATDQPFILRMLLEIAANTFQGFLDLGMFFLLLVPGQFIGIDPCRVLLAVFLGLCQYFLLLHQLLIK